MIDQVRILIVDDEPAVRTALKLAIRRRPWHVEEVDSAEAALKRLRTSAFDAALIDKNLPGMTGIELIREIRKTNRSLAIMVITGFASSESATESLHLGIDAYLEKPFDNVYDVAAKLENILAAHQHQRESGTETTLYDNFCAALDVLRGVSTKTKAAPELRILVACPTASEQEWFIRQFKSNSTLIDSASSSREALKYFDDNPPPHLVVTDTSIQDPDITLFVHNIIKRAPQAGLIVIAERTPLHLNLLISLIGLGVRVLVERPLEREALRKKLEHIVDKLRPTKQSAKRAKGTV